MGVEPVSRHATRAGSHSHRLVKCGDGRYEMRWHTNHWARGSRLRVIAAHSRDTNEVGAKRFAKRWGVKMPEDKKKGEW